SPSDIIKDRTFERVLKKSIHGEISAKSILLRSSKGNFPGMAMIYIIPLCAKGSYLKRITLFDDQYDSELSPYGQRFFKEKLYLIGMSVSSNIVVVRRDSE